MDGVPEAAEREVNLVQVAPQRMSRSLRAPKPAAVAALCQTSRSLMALKPAAVARRGKLLAANLHTGVRAASILFVGVAEDRKGKDLFAVPRHGQDDGDLRDCPGPGTSQRRVSCFGM